jgi:integrase
MGRGAFKRETITPAKMRAYPLPASGYRLVYDVECRKLALAIHASGLKTFKFIYNFRGRSRWKTIGEVGIVEARRKAYELAVAVANGRDPQGEHVEDQKAGSFLQLRDRYYSEFANANLKASRHTHWLLEHYIDRRFNEAKVATLTKADVKAVIGPLADRPSVAAQVLSAVSSVLQWGVDEALVIQTNPARGVKTIKLRARERILSNDEIKAFWAEFGKHGDAGIALKILILLGQRPGEIAHMNFAHIKNHWWEMPGAASDSWPGTKNQANHMVWLPEAAMALLPAPQPSGLVFGPRPDLLVGAMQRAMMAICKKLKVERATPHDLRRTNGSAICRLLGFGGRAAMNRIQNHKEGGIATVYDRHQYSEETKRVMEMVAAELMRLALGKDVGGNVVAIRG